MSKLFIGYALCWYRDMMNPLMDVISGLAWHTNDITLRQKFEEFGQVEEAVLFPARCILP